MTQEDYVSIETAKLLKEKGFDWEESPFYCEQDRDEWMRENNYTVPNPYYDSEVPFDTETLTMIAPHVSLQMAMKWLRKMYNLFIVIDRHYFAVDRISHISTGFKYSIEIKTINAEYVHNDYKSYEEACEAAIKYCLENLI